MKDGDWQDAPDLYVLDFQSETQFTLNLDINAGGGKWEQPDEGKIHFFEMSFTEACCDSQFAIDMLEIFGTVEVYELDGQILTLGGDGKIVLKAI